MEKERTFVAIKPDGVLRGIAGKIITRFEEKGYKIIAMKMMTPTMEIAAKHYEEHYGKPFYDGLVKYITSGPIIAMVIEGVNAVKGARHLMGITNPDEADVGSIRADFAQIMNINVIHGSDSVESAKREIGIYFKPEELNTNWKTVSEMIIDEI